MEILTDTPVRYFISGNGIQMVEGNKFNWQYFAYLSDNSPECYTISLSSWSTGNTIVDGVSMSYKPKARIFSINGLKFKVRDLEEAETMVQKFIAGSKIDMGRLYIKSPDIVDRYVSKF